MKNKYKYKYIDYIIETARNGYFERYYIQAENIKTATETAKKEYNLIIDINSYFVI